MARILVAGLVNLETTLRVEGFPLEYYPVTYPFGGVHSTVSGVGYNLVTALKCLGDEPVFAALLGADEAGLLARRGLERAGVGLEWVKDALDQTPQSVILYDPSGRRQIHVDLKDIQEQTYPAEDFRRAAPGCRLAVLCNINFTRPLLAQARELGLPVATDVHAIADLDDAYNRDYMAAAEILFMSHEHLPCPPEEWVRRVWARYPARLVGIGLGADGALLGVRDENCVLHFPATVTRPVVNTIGAGDALFSAFLHEYVRNGDPREAMRKATIFASYKIGESGGVAGFLDQAALDRLAA